ncbi:chaplin [Streptomyces sp. NPDC056773]|uniref:chaplin n=1 Tax=unclassified Streptomyces TaxID=2593676 RepID=UPI0036BCFCE0
MESCCWTRTRRARVRIASRTTTPAAVVIRSSEPDGHRPTRAPAVPKPVRTPDRGVAPQPSRAGFGACGNSASVIGLLNPAFGNTCVNARGPNCSGPLPTTGSRGPDDPSASLRGTSGTPAP